MPLELKYKAARVLGTFGYMIGAGIVMDTNQTGLGISVMAVCAASVVGGLIANRRISRKSA